MTLATTVDALINRVRRDSLMASRGPVYTLGGAYLANAVSLVLAETPTHIGQGEILSVDYELFYVLAADSSTKTVTVIPGYFGSTPANHDAGAIVEVAPRFPKASLLDGVQQEIMSWGNELWRVTRLTLPLVTTARTYDLTGVTGEVYFLLDVRQQPLGSSTSYWNFSWPADAWPHLDGRLLRMTGNAEFPSGFGLQLNGMPNVATDARITLAQPFDLDPLVSTTDLVTDVGLRVDWLDIVEYGVKARALEASSIGRSDWRTGNMARNAEEVSALDTVRIVAQFRDTRQLRFARAAVDLRSEFPYRRV